MKIRYFILFEGNVKVGKLMRDHQLTYINDHKLNAPFEINIDGSNHVIKKPKHFSTYIYD